MNAKHTRAADGRGAPIAFLRATVEFPLYEGDKIDRAPDGWNDFIYEDPGIKDGHLAVCRRKCKTLSVEVRHEE